MLSFQVAQFKEIKMKTHYWTQFNQLIILIKYKLEKRGIFQFRANNNITLSNRQKDILCQRTIWSYLCLFTFQNPNSQLYAEVILKRKIEIILVLMPIKRENQNSQQVFNNQQNGRVSLILELCHEGDIKNYLVQENQPFYQDCCSYNLWILDILQIVIKSANILISNGTFKIDDLGIRGVIEDINYAQNCTEVGSPAYAVPKLFLVTKFPPKLIFIHQVSQSIMNNYLYELIHNHNYYKIKKSQSNIKIMYCAIKCKRLKLKYFIIMKMKDALGQMSFHLMYWHNTNLKLTYYQSLLKLLRIQFNLDSYLYNSKSFIEYMIYQIIKILQTICILITKTDLANKFHKYVKEQNFSPFEIRRINIIIFIYFLISIKINQKYFRVITQLQAIIFPQVLKENYQINDINSRSLKKYIHPKNPQYIISIIERSIIIFVSRFKYYFKSDLPKAKQLKKVLEQDDDTNYLFFAQIFSFIFHLSKNSFQKIQMNQIIRSIYIIIRLLNLLRRINIFKLKFLYMNP
ncbi:unnamed protein product [Paramecium primaurelia]|uniref:Protein kinase domain-containing protein n=1 Tax=Paramecium primaurelia TaxID=5886 RepID=A0A8S1QNY2_PARPR|nr:unnamed protein product [Paramecium primaurelia]